MVAPMPTLTLKNLPSKLHRELKHRAKVHHRSLNREAIATLQCAVATAQPRADEALEQDVRRVRSYFKRPVTAREIDRWKQAGRP